MRDGPKTPRLIPEHVHTLLYSCQTDTSPGYAQHVRQLDGRDPVGHARKYDNGCTCQRFNQTAS